MAVWALIIIILAALALSARFTFWRPNLPGVPALMYHYLTDDLAGTSIKKLRVSPEAFTRQMDYLVRQGYRTIGFADVRRGMSEGRELPAKSIVITFDDAAEETLALAEKILSARGLTAVVFVVSGLVGQTNVWDRPKGEPEIKLAGWEQLRALAEAGWEIGSHTRSHAELTGLSDAELEAELAESKKELERNLDREVTTLAYPYGTSDDRVKQAAEKVGYQTASTTRPGKINPGDDPFGLPRIIIKRKDTILDFWLKLKKARSNL